MCDSKCLTGVFVVRVQFFRSLAIGHNGEFSLLFKKIFSNFFTPVNPNKINRKHMLEFSLFKSTLQVCFTVTCESKGCKKFFTPQLVLYFMSPLFSQRALTGVWIEANCSRGNKIYKISFLLDALLTFQTHRAADPQH